MSRLPAGWDWSITSSGDDCYYVEAHPRVYDLGEGVMAMDGTPEEALQQLFHKLRGYK